MTQFLWSLVSDSAEWLEVDGLGGFASGTTAEIRTRRYHALLLTATSPPSERKTLVNGLEVWIETTRGKWFLSSQRYGPDVIYPDGMTHIKSFSLGPGRRGDLNWKIVSPSNKSFSCPTVNPRSS